MKRIPLTLLALLLAASLLFACGPATPAPAKDTDTTTQPPAGEVTTAAPDDPAPAEEIWLVKDGKSDFKIVNAVSGSTEAILNAPDKIQSRILAITGVELPIVNARNVGADEPCIVVGSNSRIAETAEVLSEWGPGEYGHLVRNGRLLVLGHSNAMTEKALTNFMTVLLVGGVKKDGRTDLRINLSAERSRFDYDNWLSGVPCPTGTLGEVYDSGDQTYMLQYKSFSTENYAEYQQTLVAEGFRKVQENTVKELMTATYLREGAQVNLTFFSADHLLHATYQNLENTVTIPNLAPETGYTKLGENTLAVMSLNYEVNCTDQNDTSGISYVIILEDGRYVIVDGGYAGDVHGLYNFLVDNNRRSDGIVIAAWFFTHAHGDHIGCFDQFIRTYASQVTCQYFVSNAYPSSASLGPSSLNGLSNIRNLFKGDTKHIKPHSGEKMYFCNVEVEILATHEDMYPRTITNLNEASMIFRFKVGGQTILILGDAELQEIPFLNSLYRDALKSDVMQVPHHGWSDVGSTIFGYVDPDVVIWPSGEQCVRYRLDRNWRNGIYNDLVNKVGGLNGGAVFLASGPVQLLPLPYAAGGTYTTYTMDFQKRG